MKKLIAGAFAMISFAGLAENYFQEGMRWDLLYYPAPINPAQQDLSPVAFSQFLQGDDFKAGKECLKLFTLMPENNGEPQLLTYIHSEGDKVYFLSFDPDTDPEAGEWMLLYDFGMRPGDKAEIGHMFFDDAYVPELSSIVTCVEIVSGESAVGNYKRLLMSETFADIADADANGQRVSLDYSSYTVHGEWIDGIGAAQGACCNGAWDLDGVGGSKLLKATLNGRTLYLDNSASLDAVSLIDPVTESSAPCYKPDGTIFTPDDKGICISAGRKYLRR